MTCCVCKQSKTLQFSCSQAKCNNFEFSRPQNHGNGICEQCNYKYFNIIASMFHHSRQLKSDSEMISILPQLVQAAYNSNLRLEINGWKGALNKYQSESKNLGWSSDRNYENVKMMATFYSYLELNKIIQNNRQNNLKNEFTRKISPSNYDMFT